MSAPPARGVVCPQCQAVVGAPCVTRSGAERTAHAVRARAALRSAAAVQAFRPDLLAYVNRMDRSADPLEVAAAALRHHAFVRGPVPDYHGALAADRLADVVLAALYRRGMLA